MAVLKKIKGRKDLFNGRLGLSFSWGFETGHGKLGLHCFETSNNSSSEDKLASYTLNIPEPELLRVLKFACVRVATNCINPSSFGYNEKHKTLQDILRECADRIDAMNGIK